MRVSEIIILVYSADGREINTEGGLTDLKELPDARLFEICRPKERTIGNHYISQTFGEILYKDETSTQGQPTEIRENLKIYGNAKRL